MDPAGQSRIPAHTRRQTMDWGLVLMSQGITATIDDGADGASWGLLVAPEDYPAALEAIRLYRLENRHWRWLHPLPWRGILFDWRVCFWGLLLAAFFASSRLADSPLAVAGRMDNAAVMAGQWWRIFTAMLLHADAGHLASNLAVGLLLLGLTMARYGGGLGLLLAYLAGAGGNLAGLLVYPPTHLGVGASGMVMGGLGMLAIQSVTILRRSPAARKPVLRGIMAGVMLFALFGLSPGTDVVAHFGGFVSGMLLGGVLLWLSPRRQRPKMDLAAAVLLASLVVVTSWLAFR